RSPYAPGAPRTCRSRRHPARLGPTRTREDTGPPTPRTPHDTTPAVRARPRPRPEPTAHRAGPTARRTAAPSHRPAQPSHHSRTSGTPPRTPVAIAPFRPALTDARR